MANIIRSPLTAIGCTLGCAFLCDTLSGMGAFGMVVIIVLAGIGILSALLSMNSAVLKWICVGLCAIAVLSGIIDSRPDATPAPAATVAAAQRSGSDNQASGSSSRSGSYGSGPVSVKTAAPTKSTSRDCNYCKGSGKCHVCNGKGSQYCPSWQTCSNGKCVTCKGTGYYNNGKTVSLCRVCKGKGKCPTCNGTTRYDCSICVGGKCSHCGGTGKR